MLVGHRVVSDPGSQITLCCFGFKDVYGVLLIVVVTIPGWGIAILGFLLVLEGEFLAGLMHLSFFRVVMQVGPK